nr:DUF2298 domain-containing protein [Ardenticatena sp.]
MKNITTSHPATKETPILEIPLRTRVRLFVTSEAATPFVFALILLLAAGLRYIGLNWDEYQHLHPDERFLTMVETALGWPSSFSEYLDESRSPLNPRNVGYDFFVYGTLPLTIVKGVALLLDRTDYNQVHLVGRALSATFDLFSIVFLFLLARRLYRDDRIALLASFLLATTVLSIQHAHFFVVDTFANFFIVGALSFLARAQASPRWYNWVLTGVFFGAAMASKISVFTFALVVTLVGGYHVWRAYERATPERAVEAAMIAAERIFLRLVLTALVAFLVFRIGQPDAFRGPGLLGIMPSERWWQNMQQVRLLVSGEVDYPPGHQWTGRTPLWFPWKNMVLWGMGLPLGLTAWLGWGVALYRLVRRREWAHLIPVAWVGILFLHQGTQWVKSLRYMLPIYPTLALLAAWLLIWLWDCARAGKTIRLGRWWLRWTPALAGSTLSLVAVGTLLWALAFTSIYTRPHSRVQASRWMYENIPPGSTIANEHWDDPLPLRIDGKDPFGGMYRGIEMQWYAEDTPEKLQQALTWLDEADYIVLSSNRLYDSIPRLPKRYPMTINYYRALFDGRLGFEKVAEFTSYPQLFGIEIPDQSAEEAFSVYDHPRVQIFKKTPAYDRVKAEQILSEGVSWDAIVRYWPKQASEAPTALMLPDELVPVYRQHGTWSAMFDPDGIANRVPVLVWALALVLLGAVATPYLFVLARPLPDRGYAFARIMGLLMVGWLVWQMGSWRLFTYTRASIWLAIAVWALGAVMLAVRRHADMLAFVRTHRRLLLIEELFFWGFFGLFLLVRWANPDLWHPILGGEKPMDFAFLNATIKSAYFPPYDPWYAGGYINYYYFGFVLMATLIKLTGVVPYVAYNLAIPTLFAMTAMGAFGGALALLVGTRRLIRTRDVGFAFLGALFVAVIGNLGELKLILDGFASLSTLQVESSVPGVAFLIRALHGFVTGFLAGQSLPFRIEWWYWNATRVIQHPVEEPGPITEFPWFTFLYADLHAHMMALPLTLLALGMALTLLYGSRTRGLGEWVRLGAAALVVGALWPTNTWDFPTYAVLVGVALVLREWYHAGRLTLEGIWQALWRWGVVVFAGYVAFWPFHRWYGSAYNSITRWQGSRTSLQDYLIIHGFFLFIIVAALASDFFYGRGQNGIVRTMRLYWRSIGRWRRLTHRITRFVRPGLGYALGFYLLAIVGVGVLIAVLAGMFVPALILTLLVMTTLLAFRRTPAPMWQMALAMVGLALVLTFVVEFIVLEGDVGRMNTVFKFYMQVWVLFGIASAMAAAYVWQLLPRWRSGWAWFWRWGFVLLFVATMLYPVLATRAKIADRFDPSVGPSLNGMAFMDKAVHYDQNQPIELKWDKAAIEWVLQNVEGSPVFAEMNTYPVLYGWGNRFAMFTGNPAIVGWDWHERQQRALFPGELVSRRVQDVQWLYNTPDPNEAYRILRKYEAEYVVVGALERAYATPEGIAKFAQMDGILWEQVYANEQTVIYHVLGE